MRFSMFCGVLGLLWWVGRGAFVGCDLLVGLLVTGFMCFRFVVWVS